MKLNTFISLRACLCVCLLSCSFAWGQVSPTTMPDLSAGKKKASACFGCHGVEGISKMPGIPHLAGQEPGYLESALRAYRDGTTRQNATMNAMAKALTDADVANISAYYSLKTRMNNGQSAEQTLETLQRIRPVARVHLQSVNEDTNNSVSLAKSPRSGDSIYQSACSSCHGAGVAGAPKLGDKTAWAPRLNQGKTVVVKHAIEGYKGMPAKGACSNCSDEEVKAAVDYILSYSK
jgi:cytochrome c5